MFLFIIVIVLVGLINFFYLVPPVINWDEGTHALWGFKEWLALRSGDWHLFWQLSRAQFSYPPLGSWLIALTNLPSEFSPTLARFSSTLGFIFGGILLFLIARVLPDASLVEDFLRRQNPPAGGSTPRKLTNFSVCHPRLYYLLNTKYFSLLLYLTSPAILFYSVTVFKESWGMALTLLTIYFYFLATDKKKIIYYLLTGFSLTLLFFEKYNYAVLLGLVLGLEAVVEIILLIAGPARNSILSLRAPTVPAGRQEGRGNLFPFVFGIASSVVSLLTRNDKKYSRFLIKQLALFLPIIIFGSWWIFTPDNKLNQFLDIMRSDWNPVTVGAGSSWQYLTFFVQSLRVSYTFSNIIFLFTVLCYLLSIKDLWQKKIRVLWLLFALNFVLGTLHSINLQDRYILTSVPALFLIVGYESTWLAQKIFLSSQNGFLARFCRSKLLGKPSDKIRFPLQSLATKSKPTAQNFAQNNKTSSVWLLGIGNWILELGIGFLVLLLFLDFLKLPQLLKSNASHMLLSAMYNETDYRDTLFDFNKNDWPKDSKQITDNSKQKETPEDVINYILDNVDIARPINYLGWTAEISPDWVELRRQMELRRCQVLGVGCQSKEDKDVNYIVTIEVKPTSRLYTYDYRRANLWQLANIQKVAEEQSGKLVKEKDFKELGVVVRIYRI